MEVSIWKGKGKASHSPALNDPNLRSPAKSLKITAAPAGSQEEEEEQAKPKMMMNNHNHAQQQQQQQQQHQKREQDMTDDLPVPPMRRSSSSLYSLTIDEIQNSVCEPGKPFGSMNMDELIASIWNTDDYQQLLATSSGPAAAGIQSQNTLTVPASLSRKTVDEVWSEIHGNKQPSDNLNRPSSANNPPRQQTLGEMTLEDFLIKAGVVCDPLRAPMQHYAVVSFSTGSSDAHGAYGGGMMVGDENECSGGLGSPVSSVSPDMMAVEPSEADKEVWGLRARKRAADAFAVEKVAERRQRRMIKNRESAARSRARKQAYTVELEQELNQLKGENARLREEEKRSLELRKQLVSVNIYIYILH
ncbi:bZIP transcription factor MafK domain-containing protein [Dioscorea alata]|uniref:BZIP transcription factor MafK domain-containing protein n=1 Tax=Dioscorea alata TaxID=55571 RepID=A0ACB7VC79_DIOAL|nr:bZIP transcription factor MafK domain-containing protein [Dioscorea alata]